MKKYLASILSLILALAMVFTLVACGSDSSDDDDDDDVSSKSSSSQSSDDSSDESDDESSKEDKDDDASSKTSKPAKDDDASSKTSKPTKDDEEDTDSLVGDWKGTYYEFYEDLGTNYSWTVYISFDDGEYEMTYDTEEFVDAKVQWCKDSYEAAGTDFEDFLAENEYASEEEFREAGLEEMSDFVQEGTYQYDGNDFIIDDEEMSSYWDGNYFVFYNDYVEIQIKEV